MAKSNSLDCGAVVTVATSCVFPLASVPKVCVTVPVIGPVELLKVTLPVRAGDFTFVLTMALSVVVAPKIMLDGLAVSVTVAR